MLDFSEHFIFASLECHMPCSAIPAFAGGGTVPMDMVYVTECTHTACILDRIVVHGLLCAPPNPSCKMTHDFDPLPPVSLHTKSQIISPQTCVPLLCFHLTGGS